MFLSCTVYEIGPTVLLVENRLFEPTPPPFGVPVWSDPVGILPRSLGRKTLESLGYRMALFA